MNIETIKGEKMCYRVSSSDPKREELPYTVRLTENFIPGRGTFGVCNCLDFRTRRTKNIRNGASPRTPDSMCKHMLGCMMWQMGEVMDYLGERQAMGSNDSEINATIQ